MSRFSPEFTAKLRKKIGDRDAFREARMQYHQWRTSISVEVISPFCNGCVHALRRDLGSEVSEGLEDPQAPFVLPPVHAYMRGVDEQAPPLTPSQEMYLAELARRSPFRIREERTREYVEDGRRLFVREERIRDGQRPYSPEELSRIDCARVAERLVHLERQYLEISDTVARNAMRDPLHHPTATERELVEYLREKLEQARGQIREIQRRNYQSAAYERNFYFRPDPER